MFSFFFQSHLVFFLKVLDGSVITAKRTAAVSAIATKVCLLFPKSEQDQFVVLSPPYIYIHIYKITRGSDVSVFHCTSVYFKYSFKLEIMYVPSGKT